MPTKRSPTSSSRPPATRYSRIRSDHSRELAEDYVELIDDLIRETGEARAVDIAQRLGVSHVTVTKAVARLQRDGLVTSAPYRAVFLTPEGKRLAGHVRKRHETLLAFLLQIGVPRRDAEIDAEGLEHHVSSPTLAAMKRFVSENG